MSLASIYLFQALSITGQEEHCVNGHFTGMVQRRDHCDSGTYCKYTTCVLNATTTKNAEKKTTKNK
jgi:hypothetical protein